MDSDDEICLDAFGCLLDLYNLRKASQISQISKKRTSKKIGCIRSSRNTIRWPENEFEEAPDDSTENEQMMVEDEGDGQITENCKFIEKRRNRRWGIRPTNLDWLKSGYHRKVFMKLKNLDDDEFFKHTRMSKSLFGTILKKVDKGLRNMKQRIGVEERLSMTIRFLALGEPLLNIAQSYMLGKTTVRNIILKTCEVLWSLFASEYVHEPSTQDRRVELATEFEVLHDAPNCIGVLGAKYMREFSKKRFGGEPKKSNIVLMAACDAQYKFTAVNFFEQNKKDFGSTKFGERFFNEQLQLPLGIPLPMTDERFPFYFVGNITFPLRCNLIRPYSIHSKNLEEKHIMFNNQLSRICRIIENSFGVLITRWQILSNIPEWCLENCETIVLACVVLHNFLIQNDDDGMYCPKSFVDCEQRPTEEEPTNSNSNNWRKELAALGGPLRSVRPYKSRGSHNAIDIRNKLADYFYTVAPPLDKTTKECEK